jgi:hypothetical protein
VKVRTVRSTSWPLLFAAVISTWAVAGACGRGERPAQAPSTASSSTAVRVTGTEKIVWDQTAKDAAQLARHRYLAYVDDEAPIDLVGVTCGPATATESFTCSAPLPTMRPGRHRLQLAAEEADNQKRRSPKSGIILLEVVTPKTR